MRRREAILVVLAGALWTWATPGKAQFFGQFTVNLRGVVEAGAKSPPKALKVTMGLPEDLVGQKLCVSYRIDQDTSGQQSRMKARCGMWREGRLVDFQRVYGNVTYNHRFGLSTFCSCRDFAFEESEVGDVLHCHLRFRRLAAGSEGEYLEARIGITEDGKAWCGGL